MSYYIFFDPTYQNNTILNKYKYEEIYIDPEHDKYIISCPIKVDSEYDIDNIDSLELVSGYIGDTKEDLFTVYPQLDTYNIDSYGNYKHILKGIQ